MQAPLKISSQEKVLTTDLFTLYKTELKSANKMHSHYNFVRRPTVGVFPVDNNNVFLVKQYRYIYKKYMIEEPSGHVDLNESSINAAKRELKEETGIVGDRWKKLFTLNSSASVVKNSHTIYIVEDLKFDQPNPEDDEVIEVVKINIDEAIKLAFSGKITTASTIAGLLFIKNYYNR